jgi:hypothetical protein
MKLLVLLPVILFPSCVAPSLTIYGRGTAVARDGTTTEVAVKEAQIYGDLVGDTVITGSLVTVKASGGYYNSTVVRETYLGAAEIGRSTIQPIVWSIVTGGVLGTSIGAAKVAAP